MKRIIALVVLFGLLLSGCGQKQTEYVSPNYSEIREEFTPKDHSEAAELPQDYTDDTVVVTPMLPFLKK